MCTLLWKECLSGLVMALRMDRTRTGLEPELFFYCDDDAGCMPFPFASSLCVLATNQACQYSNSTPAKATVSGVVRLPANEEKPLMKALVKVGTISINVAASAWLSYEEGIFDGCNQTNPLINHVVCAYVRACAYWSPVDFTCPRSDMARV